MFGSVGGAEFLLIAVLALLLFGPRKLPQIGRSVGKALAEFRGVSRDFKHSLEQEVRLEEKRNTEPAAPTRAEPTPAPTPNGERSEDS